MEIVWGQNIEKRRDRFHGRDLDGVWLESLQEPGTMELYELPPVLVLRLI